MKSMLRGFYLAKEISKKGNYRRTKIGCVILYKKEIISTGFNSVKTHPFQDKYNEYRNDGHNKYFKASLHAEISAISKIYNRDIDFKKAIIFIYREDYNGNLANARPCKSCQMALDDIGIKTWYYTIDNGFVKEIRIPSSKQCLTIDAI